MEEKLDCKNAQLASVTKEGGFKFTVRGEDRRPHKGIERVSGGRHSYLMEYIYNHGC